MAFFGLGAGLPLVALALLSRQAMTRIRSRRLAADKFGKQALGCIMLLLGIAIISGSDKMIEAWVVRELPD
jgi:cytochrome c biogenesis protein CcdA